MKYLAGMQFSRFKILTLPLVVCLTSLFSVSHAEDPETCATEFRVCKDKNLDQLNILYNSCVTKVPEIVSADAEYALCDARYASCQSDTSHNEYLAKLKDGGNQEWETASAKSLGFNTTLFDQAFKNAGNIARFKSLTVLHKGKLVKQRHYNNSKDDPLPQPVKGITQSITSLLVGIAIEKGFIKSEKQMIKSFFPDKFTADEDKSKGDIRIQDLLTMKSGLSFSDGQDWQSWTDYFDWLRADNASDWILAKSRPGAIEGRTEYPWQYSTPGVDLLGAVIRETSGMTLKQFADQYLFKPLNIEHYLWDHDSRGSYHAGTGLRMYPDDLARIGQLVLDDGVFKGKQIVSRQWIKKSVYDTFEVRNGWNFGYLWLTTRINGIEVPHAEGFGGQYVLIVPELDTVIVTTSNTILCSGQEQRLRSQKALAVAKQIILSITDAKSRKI